MHPCTIYTILPIQVVQLQNKEISFELPLILCKVHFMIT
jgi:hypothetical protein